MQSSAMKSWTPHARSLQVGGFLICEAQIWVYSHNPIKKDCRRKERGPIKDMGAEIRDSSVW